MIPADLQVELERRWQGRIRPSHAPEAGVTEWHCPSSELRDVASTLFVEWGLAFTGLVVEEDASEWVLRYAFHDWPGKHRIDVLVRSPLATKTIPSISLRVPAADWQEREAEDLFGLVFEGHPELGDFVLHDDAWQEGLEPMRHAFAANAPVLHRQPRTNWRPRRIVDAPGSFLMPVGPVFAGQAESVHFQLETVGEDVIRGFARLFYKYRGIEKLAEGRTIDDALLLAERFSATTAFAHGLAFSHAVETACATEVPERAKLLRVFFAELERLRHHFGAIEGICESTALAVAASEAAMLEEEALRISGALAGHRYLFGLAVPGGLGLDPGDSPCQEALARCRALLARADALWSMLRLTSSFIDRLEEVGTIQTRDARAYGLVGPIARASGIANDVRAVLPTDAYGALPFSPALEHEGDGYARLRVFFTEARQSIALMSQAVDRLVPGAVRAVVKGRSGAALGAVEAPRGSAFHWLRTDAAGHVLRYRIVAPSFVNWHGFHLAVEDFAFQDFPIILATLDLSVAESDR